MKRNYFKLIVVSFILALCFSFSFSNHSRADSCIPTCDTDDSRFLTFGGIGINTFVFPNLTFGVASPAGDENLHIRIFDGDTNGQWDWNNDDFDIHLTFNLFADPTGDATGTILLGTWTSDGSSGLNTGNPMPDDDYFDIIFPNAPEAMAESGNYIYIFEAVNADTTLRYLTHFKLQTVGENTSILIFPGDQPFGFEPTYRSRRNTQSFADAFSTIFPLWDTYPDCDNIAGAFTTPGTCVYSTYDGSFSFFFVNNNPGRETLDLWDGDFDFGFEPIKVPPFQDTDDANTPPGIPPFADPLNTIPQGSNSGTDDISIVDELTTITRPPNITYELIDPNGVSYPNNNPSASGEWELFTLSTEPGCFPDTCDHEVDEIPTGIWEVRISGYDMWNIGFIRGFDQFIGLDPDNNPVMPLDPIEPLEPPRSVNVPTFSEWGMLTVAFLLGAFGLYSQRKKKKRRKHI